VGRILVGTASWTDKTLLASGWYPQDADDPAKRLEFYASQFPLVEVDSTYYTPPNERNSRLWAERTPEGFTFDVKAYSLLTQHPTRTSSLYKDLRPESDKRNIYPKDLDPAVIDEVWERFLAALEPLHDSGRLGSLLFQFPPWFGIRQSNKHDILECKRRCEPYRMCVELRNSSWMSPESARAHQQLLPGLRAGQRPAARAAARRRRRAGELADRACRRGWLSSQGLVRGVETAVGGALRLDERRTVGDARTSAGDLSGVASERRRARGC
jgi:uncharacterized protein YecE (DUF72 family)